jgi:hypothetical protein
MRVEVSQQHIDAGNRAQGSRLSRECNCPIANALIDAGFDNPKVSYGSFTAGRVAGNVVLRRRYRLPAAAITFIENYDDARHVEPFAFDVDRGDFTEVLRRALCAGSAP